MVSDLTIVAPTVSLALLYHGRGVPVYAYTMSLPPAAQAAGRSWWGSYHSMELNYVFGSPFVGFNTDSGEEQTFSDSDRNASLLIMAMWSNFAKFGCVDWVLNTVVHRIPVWLSQIRPGPDSAKRIPRVRAQAQCPVSSAVT